MNDELKTGTIEIRPKRVFRCPRDKENWQRSQVKKTSDGRYLCPRHNEVLEDVTNTETGKEILRWL